MQKCDANRPCTTCTLANTISACTYDNEEDPQSDSEGVLRPPSTDSLASGQHIGGANPVEIPTVVTTYLPARLDSPTPTATTREVTDEPLVLRMHAAGRVPHGPSSGLVLARRNSSGRCNSLDSNPSIFTPSSISPPTIPPEPWMPLSFLGKEQLQVQFSVTEVIDLDLRLYVLELERSVTNSPSVLDGCGFCLGYSS